MSSDIKDKMKQNLYWVGLRHKKTGEEVKLNVWAENVDEATGGLCGILVGYHCEYAWTGSGPVYENNKTVSRESSETGQDSQELTVEIDALIKNMCKKIKEYNGCSDEYADRVMALAALVEARAKYIS